MDVSVIVRFHNEAPYLEATLRSVKHQRFPNGDVEIIAVDNNSVDGSRDIAERYADQILTLDTYWPGKALNLAIEMARGRYISVLSAHTIPSDPHWLARLWAHMSSPRLAGVYGAQLYNLHSKFLDKRDLDIFSTLEPRVETGDSDFWNANSMFSRAVWERHHFDESVYELEDHYWTKILLPQGFEVHFEPRALVYHYSHIRRLDREFLAKSNLSEQDRIEQAMAELTASDADWPRVMNAGLTLSSLTSSPHIHRAVPAIGYQLTTHWDFDVRWRMAQALGKIPISGSVAYLVAALEDKSFYPRDEAAWSLARLGALAVPDVRRAVVDLPAESLPFAALALGCSGVTEAQRLAVDILLAELGSSNSRRRRDAAYFAGEMTHVIDARALIPGIATLLEEDDTELSKVGCWALGCFEGSTEKGTGHRNQLERIASQHSDVLVRFEATVALGKLARRQQDHTAVRSLLSACGDSAERVRYGALQSLRLLSDGGFAATVPAELESDPDFGVQYEFSLLESSRAKGRTGTGLGPKPALL
jgi:hypothetical protein